MKKIFLVLFLNLSINILSSYNNIRDRQINDYINECKNYYNTVQSLKDKNLMIQVLYYMSHNYNPFLIDNFPNKLSKPSYNALQQCWSFPKETYPMIYNDLKANNGDLTITEGPDKGKQLPPTL